MGEVGGKKSVRGYATQLTEVQESIPRTLEAKRFLPGAQITGCMESK